MLCIRVASQQILIKCLHSLYTRATQLLGLEAPSRNHMDKDAVDQVTVDVRDAPAAEAKLTPTENRGHVMLCIRVYTGCITANPD
jgi:hypothetical protein